MSRDGDNFPGEIFRPEAVRGNGSDDLGVVLEIREVRPSVTIAGMVAVTLLAVCYLAFGEILHVTMADAALVDQSARTQTRILIRDGFENRECTVRAGSLGLRTKSDARADARVVYGRIIATDRVMSDGFPALLVELPTALEPASLLRYEAGKTAQVVIVKKRESLLSWATNSLLGSDCG